MKKIIILFFFLFFQRIIFCHFKISYIHIVCFDRIHFIFISCIFTIYSSALPQLAKNIWVCDLTRKANSLYWESRKQCSWSHNVPHSIPCLSSLLSPFKDWALIPRKPEQGTAFFWPRSTSWTLTPSDVATEIEMFISILWLHPSPHGVRITVSFMRSIEKWIRSIKNLQKYVDTQNYRNF